MYISKQYPISLVLLFQYLLQRLIYPLFHPKVMAWDLCYSNFCLFGPKEAAYL